MKAALLTFLVVSAVIGMSRAIDNDSTLLVLNLIVGNSE
jgi:hypothetical protein